MRSSAGTDTDLSECFATRWNFVMNGQHRVTMAATATTEWTSGGSTGGKTGYGDHGGGSHMGGLRPGRPPRGQT